MSRMNGQVTWVTPVVGTTAAPLGDDANAAAGTVTRVFTATERMTVVEVGVVPLLSTTPLLTAFKFTVSKRTAGVVASDTIIPVWKAAFAAEGGPGGDPSVSNFDQANAISGGAIQPPAAGVAAGKCLRAFTEVSLDKGDMLVFKVTVANGAAAQVAYYAKAYYMGAGIVEGNDVDSL